MTDQSSDPDHRPRRIDLHLVAKYPAEEYLDEDGNVDEKQMLREALSYAEEAAQEHAFDTEITPIDEIE